MASSASRLRLRASPVEGPVPRAPRIFPLPAGRLPSEGDLLRGRPRFGCATLVVAVVLAGSTTGSKMLGPFTRLRKLEIRNLNRKLRN